MKRLAALCAAAAIVVAFARPAVAGSGGSFFTRCNFDQLKQVDPIMEPGVPMSMHLHAFYGAQGVTELTMPQDLVTATSTCSTPDDRSAYWYPTLLDSTGIPVPSPNVNAYYRSDSWTPTTMPTGTELVGTKAKFTCGDGVWANLTAGQVPWSCAGRGPAVNGNNGVFPRILVYFPNCVLADGTIAYGGTCVSRLPRLELDIRWDTRTSIAGLHLSSGAWSTMHGDFMFGWDPYRFDSLVSSCLDAHVVCGHKVV